MIQEKDGSDGGDIWRGDASLGEVTLRRQRHEVRIAIQEEAESFRRGYGEQQIIALSANPGVRTTVSVQPYIIIPDISLSPDAYSQVASPDALIHMLGNDPQHDRHIQIGSGLAWYFPVDHTIFLARFDISSHFLATREITTDPAFLHLWQGFERYLLARFPDASRMMTSAGDAATASTSWNAFLTRLGYQSASAHVWAKPTNVG
jgi:hypothetical protein